MPLLLDIGANIGAYAIEAASTRKYSRIVCVEPARVCLPQLNNARSRLARRGVDVTIVQLAVSDANDQLVTLYEGKMNVLSTLHSEWLSSKRFAPYPQWSGGAACSYPVRTTTIDTLIEEHGMPDLVKIDVECHEEQALMGLSQKVPLLCFEWAFEHGECVKRILARLKALGFTQMHVQFGDVYTYRPSSWESISPDDVNLVGKLDWGMVWVR
jgi:FkbM family methyltransferase